MSETAVIVNRVSSARQEEGFSLEAQQELNERYCTQKKLDLVRIFTFAESAGDQKQRHEFEKVLKFITEKGIKHLVLEKTDRLIRNMTTDYVVMQQYIKAGMTLHLVKENLVLHKESGSTDTFLFDINVVIAKRFLSNLSEETKKGLNKKIKSGGYPMRAPFGYHMLEKKLVQNKDAETVKKVFELYASGTYSTITLAAHLTALGIMPPRGKTWHAQSVYKILTNPAYIGKIRWKEKVYNGTHDPLISIDTWAAVESHLKHMGHSKTLKHYSLARLMRMENGRSMSGEEHKGHVYYAGWIESRKRRVYVREDDLFRQIDAHMSTVSWTESFRDQILDACKILLEETSKDIEPKIKATEKRLAEIRGKVARLLDIRLSMEIEKETYEQKHSELQSAIVASERELFALKKTDEQLTNELHRMAETFISLPKIYAGASVAGKGAILRDLVENIVYNGDKTLTLHYLSPFKYFVTAEIIKLKNGPSDPVRFLTVLRPLGESNPCCGNENPES